MRRAARRATACVALALPLAAAGCGGGDRVTQTRDVAPFDEIVVSGGLEVAVVPGGGRAIDVHAGEDVQDRVTARSQDGVLRLGIEDRGIVIGGDPLGDARVRVGADALRAVRIEGTGEVTLRGVDEPALELGVEGAGDIAAEGRVDALDLSVQGAGDADLDELEARAARVSLQGAGDAELAVSEALDVTVRGAGDVAYRGSPRVTQDVQGAADVRRTGP